MIYITGDTHRDFKGVVEFCERNETTKEDILIILGDSGINYYGNDKGDLKLKKKLRHLPITLFNIRGNHETAPYNIDTYKETDFLNGKVYMEEAFPNLIFAKDGESYDFMVDGEEKKVMVIGGAYSVDKFYRIERGLSWFDDEQPTPEIRKHSEANLEALDWGVDYMLTHTCPIKYEPREVFLPMIDQSTVDNATEQWLDEIEDKLEYEKWYCGHYHTSKTIDRMVFMFDDFRLFGR